MSDAGASATLSTQLTDLRLDVSICNCLFPPELVVPDVLCSSSSSTLFCLCTQQHAAYSERMHVPIGASKFWKRTVEEFVHASRALMSWIRGCPASEMVSADCVFNYTKVKLPALRDNCCGSTSRSFASFEASSCSRGTSGSRSMLAFLLPLLHLLIQLIRYS